MNDSTGGLSFFYTIFKFTPFWFYFYLFHMSQCHNAQMLVDSAVNFICYSYISIHNINLVHIVPTIITESEAQVPFSKLHCINTVAFL